MLDKFTEIVYNSVIEDIHPVVLDEIQYKALLEWSSTAKVDDAYACLTLASKHLNNRQFQNLYQTIATRDDFDYQKCDINTILKHLNERWEKIKDNDQHDDQSITFSERQIKVFLDAHIEKDPEKLKTMLLEQLEDGDEATSLYLVKQNVSLDMISPLLGVTLLTIAHSLRLQKCIVEMYARGAKPGIDQFTLMNKMSRIILDIPGRSPHDTDALKSIFLEMLNDPFPDNELKHISRDLVNGLCYGFSIYWLYLQKLNKGDEFKDDLNEIISWNGEASTLSKSLEDKLRLFFDNVFFLSWTGAGSIIAPKQYMDRRKNVHELLNIIKNPNQPDIDLEYKFAFVMNKKELKMVLSELIHDDKMIRLSLGQSHWAGLMKKNGLYHYYDPSSEEFFSPTPDLDEIVEAIINSYIKYYKVSVIHSSVLYGVGIFIFDEALKAKKDYPTHLALIEKVLSLRSNPKKIDLEGCSMYQEKTSSLGVPECSEIVKSLVASKKLKK